MDNQPSVVTPQTQPTAPAGPIPAPTPVQSPTIKHAHKFIFGYLALIILVAAVAGVYEWQHKKLDSASQHVNSLESQLKLAQQSASSKSATTQSVNSYAGWKTYTDTKNGISFKYPSNWYVVESSLPIITVSSANPTIVESSSDTAQYSDNLRLSITPEEANTVNANVSAANPLYAKLASSESILQPISVNGNQYSLEGSAVAGSSSITQVFLVQCKTDGTCASNLLRSNSQYITATVDSIANTQAATIPININSSDYGNVELILESLKF